MGRKLTVLWDEGELGNSVMPFACSRCCCYPSQGHFIMLINVKPWCFVQQVCDYSVGLCEQGWISDMGIDGPTFDPKSGYFLLIWGKVCPQKLAFSYIFCQFYELAFFTKCWLFQTKNPPLSLFLAFWLLYFHNFVQILFEKSQLKLP